MKTSLSHLPVDKQEEIRSIAETIVELIKPEMVILFGSYSRGDWVEDRYMEDGILHEYKSDYDILVITKHHQDMPCGLSKRIRRKVRKAENLQTIPQIIFHDIKFINTELEEGHYFFVDIAREGTMLYTTNNYELATPRKLSGKQRARLAQQYFDTWFKRANLFYESSQVNFEKGPLDKEYYALSIFELHQSAERYYTAILLVFTHYKPNTHDLQDLNKQAGYCDARFKTAFPVKTEGEKRLFKLLVKAYIDSRYKLDYKVTPEELQWLAGRVQKLKELTERICGEKIGEFVRGVSSS